MKGRLGSRACLAAVVITLFSALAAVNACKFAKEFPDEREYWTLAHNLVHAGMLSLDGMMPSAYRPPLLAWILSPLAAAGTTMSVARVCFVLFYALSGMLAAIWLASTFPKARFLPAAGAVLILANPLYFFAAGNLYPQQVLTPVLLAILLLACSQSVSFSGSLARALGIGALTAASLLTSTSSLFSLIPFFAFLVFQDICAILKKDFSWAHRFIAAVLMTMLGLAPYLYRNHTQVHPGIYLSLNSGINLLLGNAPHTTPNSGVDVDLVEYHPERFASESEFDLNRRLTQAAVDNIRLEPPRYGNLYLQKFLAGLSNTVVTVTHGRSGVGTALLWTYMSFVWIGVGLLLRVTITFHNRKNAAASTFPFDVETLKLVAILILSAYLLNLIGYSIFFNRLRFRLPLDVALALLSAVGWYSWSQDIKAGFFRQADDP